MECQPEAERSRHSVIGKYRTTVLPTLTHWPKGTTGGDLAILAAECRAVVRVPWPLQSPLVERARWEPEEEELEVLRRARDITWEYELQDAGRSACDFGGPFRAWLSD